MITLTLLHPIQSTPVQNWSFENQPVIRIGRSSDNHVILYSAVVSRHHVELRQVGTTWEVVNLGANGTYLNGKQITQMPLVDGAVIRLARSGPNIQIQLGSGAASVLSGEKTLSQRAKSKVDEMDTEGQVAPRKAIAHPTVPPPTESPKTEIDQAQSVVPTPAITSEQTVSEMTMVELAHKATQPDDRRVDEAPVASLLFSPTSGEPLQVLQTVRDYQVLKPLRQDCLTTTQIVWRAGQSLLLHTLNVDGLNHAEASEQFRQQAKALLALRHPGIPQFFDLFDVAGQPYLALEWLHGQSLRQRVETQGTLSPMAAIATILQLCQVLTYLHQQSPPILHLDLQPDRVIHRLSATGEQIAITGFLMLKPLQPATAFVGTSYAAPEPPQGQASPASDLFAIGTILVYLLTGRSPREFYANGEQGSRFSPESVPGLTADLAAIVRKLTHPTPSDRYSSASEVAAALSQIAIEGN